MSVCKPSLSDGIMGTRIKANGGIAIEPVREDQKPVWEKENHDLYADPGGEQAPGKAMPEVRAARLLF